MIDTFNIGDRVQKQHGNTVYQITDSHWNGIEQYLELTSIAPPYEICEHISQFEVKLVASASQRQPEKTFNIGDQVRSTGCNEHLHVGLVYDVVDCYTHNGEQIVYLSSNTKLGWRVRDGIYATELELVAHAPQVDDPNLPLDDPKLDLVPVETVDDLAEKLLATLNCYHIPNSTVLTADAQDLLDLVLACMGMEIQTKSIAVKTALLS